jgi:hypothetical protein
MPQYDFSTISNQPITSAAISPTISNQPITSAAISPTISKQPITAAAISPSVNMQLQHPACAANPQHDSDAASLAARTQQWADEEQTRSRHRSPISALLWQWFAATAATSYRSLSLQHGYLITTKCRQHPCKYILSSNWQSSGYEVWERELHH